MQAFLAKRIMHSRLRPCDHHCWHRSGPERPSLDQTSLFSPAWRMCPSFSVFTGESSESEIPSHSTFPYLSSALNGVAISSLVSSLLSCEASLWQGVLPSLSAGDKLRVRSRDPRTPSHIAPAVVYIAHGRSICDLLPKQGWSNADASTLDLRPTFLRFAVRLLYT